MRHPNAHGYPGLPVCKQSICEIIDILTYYHVTFRQSPHCEGFYRERYIFTTTSSSTEYFIPAFTRTSKKGSTAYVLNGGAAHGLSVGDEFALHQDMDDLDSRGTLVVDKVGPFYSIMLPRGNVAIGYHSVASRVSQPLRIYSRPGDKAFEILRDSAQDFSQFAFVRTPDDCNVDISVQGDQAIVRLTSMSHNYGFRIQPTTAVLAHMLRAPWQFFSELDRTAYCPGITDTVQFEISELQSSASQFPGAPTTELLPWKAIPCEKDSFTLRHGFSYGLELTNNSSYDLYPMVQWFGLSDKFKFGELLSKLQL